MLLSYSFPPSLAAEFSRGRAYGSSFHPQGPEPHEIWGSGQSPPQSASELRATTGAHADQAVTTELTAHVQHSRSGRDTSSLPSSRSATGHWSGSLWVNRNINRLANLTFCKDLDKIYLIAVNG